MKYDLPPTENHPRPNFDSKIERRIREIGFTDANKPFLRIVWGASMDSSYIWAGEQHMVYRDHIDHDNCKAWPAYNLDGSFSHYQQFYHHGDVYPPDIYLEDVTIETDVGIPRFFIEYATSINPEEWAATRWTDEAGRHWSDGKGNLLDFRGPCPEGAIIYEPLWLCADHKGCCVKVGQMNIGLKANREQCFGIYRDPNMRDVRECESRWAQVMVSRSDTYGLRDEVPSELVRQDVSTHAIGHRDYWQKREEEIAGDYFQNMIAHSKRLTTDGHGLDLHKYTDVGQALKTLKENESNPEAYSGKLRRDDGPTSSK